MSGVTEPLLYPYSFKIKQNFTNVPIINMSGVTESLPDPQDKS